MYSEKYRRLHEFTGMDFTIKNTPDTRPQPPVALQMAEEGTLLERLLREAVTPEERVLLCLIDDLIDEAWRLPVGKERGRLTAKTLRGELKRMFLSKGYSKRRFYIAFHNIEQRILA